MNLLIENIYNISSEEYQDVYLSLDNNLKNHILKKVRDKDKMLSLAGYVLLKRLDVDVSKIYFSDNLKPLSKDIYFSISNKGEVVTVIKSNFPVGIDIEIIKPFNKSILKFFSEAERKYIKDDLEKFFKIWTAKEAYIKMINKSFKDLFELDIISLSKCIDFEYKKYSDYLICYCYRKKDL